MDFFVKIWFLKAFDRFTLPDEENLKRLAAARFDFILGITTPEAILRNNRRGQI